MCSVVVRRVTREGGQHDRESAGTQVTLNDTNDKRTIRVGVPAGVRGEGAHVHAG